MSNSQFVALVDAAYLSNRDLPNAPDGRYDWQAKPKNTPPNEITNQQHSLLWRAVTKVETAVKQGPLFEDPLKAMGALIQALGDKDEIDDRKGIFTMGLSALCKIDPDLEISKTLNDKVMTVLYDTLTHPPAAYIGTDNPLPPTLPLQPIYPNEKQVINNTGSVNPDVGTNDVPKPSAPQAQPPRLPFAFRSADGGGNNPCLPQLGKSGTPYARSVQSKHPLPPHALPEASLVFDALLKARDWQPHPGRNSSLTFAFASLVTHSLFRTDPRDNTKNNTTSYLDLSILYGVNQAQQDLVRDRKSGRGMLWPDAFAEDRLVLVPAAATALLVIFSRNHNYIAEMLLKINERKRWSDPPPEDAAKRALQDEEIFQTARLVNCGHFMGMIFGDYVAGFLGLPRDGSSWSMNPFDPIKDGDRVVGRGEGNHVSVEFNLLYRWHSVTSEKDIKWTEDILGEAFQTRDFESLQLKDFVPAVGRAWSKVDPNPRTREFGGIKRDPKTMLFNDDELARILHDATESCAGAYRARGTPVSLKLIECLSIEQARTWGVCTMNEFRKFLGLKPFDTFEEWSSVPEVAQAARQLYGHIDYLELYPGLQAEDCMPLGPGSGICCGYTMTRAILGDAIALVRGDRFYTHDYTPTNLTAWGFQDCARDPNNGAFGAALPRLLFRHLPRHYPANSAYGLFPFFIPEVTKKNLTKLGIVDQYTFERPKTQPIPKVVDTLHGIRYVFNDFKKFKTTYSDMKMLTEDYGFFLVFDEIQKHDTDKAMLLHALFPDKESIRQYVEAYKSFTKKLIAEKSYKIDGVRGTRVDIVRNVINLVSVHWVAEYLIGIPLKTKENRGGMLTEQEVYDMLMLLFTCVFQNTQPEHGWALRHGAQKVGKVINSLIENSIKEAKPSTGGALSGLVGGISSLIWPPNKPYHKFLGKLADSGRPMKELVAQVIGLAVGSSVNYAQAVAQVVDFYLDDERVQERNHITLLAQSNDAKANALLQGYVREAQRLNPQFAGLLRVAAAADSIPLGGEKGNVDVQPGDIVFSSYRNAHLNPDDFPNPDVVDPNRPKEKYSVQGTGFHGCPGVSFAEQTIPEILKIIFSLPGLRRADGRAGKMASFMVNKLGTDNKMYLDHSGVPTPWPGSLTVIYDA